MPDCNIMIDLETLGVRPGCSILSIGAVPFGPHGLGQQFYAVINRRSCADAGLVEDSETLAWWYKQPGTARDTLHAAEGKESSWPLGEALTQLKGFLLEQSMGNDLRIWGNGADFDLPILSEAYRHCGMDVPWPAYGGRCYRTLKNLFPATEIVRSGTHHNALDDALSQAEHAIRLMRQIPGSGW